jgi:hypothetical protein
MQAFGSNQSVRVGHWYLFFRSKGSRPAHFRKDTNTPSKTSAQGAKKLQAELLLRQKNYTKTGDFKSRPKNPCGSELTVHRIFRS